ncbi:uncharacterized protein [Oryza sativa Japonica Group]|uniref:uncharacterized protein isoform X3 n=1 Tax=Oryza sativa subsp. japonica TaxID=39947 RepID=UPI0007754277|nr:uncharacterized protein LOC4343029 isoform X3 [Oryza sativa Japonica Group]
MGGDLYALDFDGVLCDSCGESSLSAVKAAKVRWPWVFEQVDAAMEEWIVEQMYTLRPVVETGYENLLLVRLLIEIRIPSARRSSVADGLSIQEILENWLKLKPTIMSEWNEDRDSLVDLFGSIRDDWIENDLSGWIGANRFYPGTADALKFSSSEVYIVTTKQGRFAEALLKELAGIEFPSERIYGLGTGPKVKVLQQLQQMPQHQGLTLHSCACAGELATSPVPTAADLRLILHKLHSVCELLRMAMEGNYVAAMGMRRLENSMTLMP